MITCPCDLYPHATRFYIVKTCTRYLCFEQKYENSQKKLTENCHFYSREKSLYAACACFLNEVEQLHTSRWISQDGHK